MAKYLPEFGWNPIVLTRKWTEDNCNYDPTIVPNLSEQIPRYEIDIPPRSRLSLASLRRLAYRSLYPGKHPIGFIDEGKRLIDEILKTHNVDAIWSTAPPNSVLSLGSYAAQQSGKPWIADFRDVWQWIPSPFVRFTLPLRFHHERNELRHATTIIAVSKGFAETIGKRVNRKVDVICHGYDEEIFAVKRDSSIQKFSIVYTGGLRLGRPNLRPLLDAIDLLIRAKKVDPSKISLDFYGIGNAEHLERMFGGHKHKYLVHDHGPIPREKVLEKQRQSALLLAATHPGMPGWLGSKMIEYVVSGRPILAIPKDHDCIDELLAETSTGISATDPEEIAKLLSYWYEEWESTGAITLSADENAIALYSGREQAKKLAMKLNKSVAEHG